MVCACRFQCTLCIADNVGDNVGDIAGMGFDLFGSFAEATGAALVPVASSPQLMTSWTALMYPVLISSLGIVVGIVTPILRNFICPLHKDFGAVGTISVLLMSPVVMVLWWMALPDEFTMSATVTDFHWWCCALAILLGLWSGLLIGLVTEYYTSNTCVLVLEIAETEKQLAVTESSVALVWDTSPPLSQSLVSASTSSSHTLVRHVRRRNGCPRYAWHPDHGNDHRCLWPNFGHCGWNCRDSPA